MPISQRSTRAIPTWNWKLIWKMARVKPWGVPNHPWPASSDSSGLAKFGNTSTIWLLINLQKKNNCESAALSTDKTGAFHPSMNSAFGKLGPTWRVSDGLHGKKSQNIPRNSSAVTTIIDSISTVVGGWPTPLKNISLLGWLFPLYGKIKNDPKHQPVVGWVSDLSPVFGQIHHWWNPYCWWEIPDSS